MKIAHLILAHKNPKQIERLLKALDHPQFYFFIHLDKKTDESGFSYLKKEGRVFFIKKRVEVRWACYSLVQAQLNGIIEILSSGHFDYINVLSGQDFPIRSSASIYEFFVEHQGTEFISSKRMEEDKEWWADALQRVKQYHFQNWRIPGKYRLQFLVNRLFPERTYPLDHVLVGRSQWFSITSACAEYLVTFLHEHPRVVHFFKYVWGADEIIFSTVVYNSPFRKNIKDNLMYVDWSEKKPNPKFLTAKDFNPMVASGKLFARKFDMDLDADIFTMLESRAAGREFIH